MNVGRLEKKMWMGIDGGIHCGGGRCEGFSGEKRSDGMRGSAGYEGFPGKGKNQPREDSTMGIPRFS
jgi:hypothetical protein